jgi:hypothetical protein
MEIKRVGTRPSGKGPAEYFTGTVRIDPLFEATTPARALGSSVTFEPGARTAWHTHRLGQTLIVTAGCGWVQREGGPVEEIRPSCWQKSFSKSPSSTGLDVRSSSESSPGLIGNLGQELSQRNGTRSEAFSISRREGSRWCLRQTDPKPLNTSAFREAGRCRAIFCLVDIAKLHQRHRLGHCFAVGLNEAGQPVKKDDSDAGRGRSWRLPFKVR